MTNSAIRMYFIKTVWESTTKINNGFLIELPDLNKSAGIIKDDTHPNEKGHKIIAETVATYLEDNNLIPCN